MIKTTSALGQNWNGAMTEETTLRNNKQLTAIIPVDLMIPAHAALLGVFPPEADTKVHVSRPHLTQHVTVRTSPPTIATQRQHCTPQCRSASPSQPGTALVPWPLTDHDNWSVLCKRDSFGGQFSIAFMPNASPFPG